MHYMPHDVALNIPSTKFRLMSVEKYGETIWAKYKL